MKERRILTARVYADDHSKASSSGRLDVKRDILATLGTWRFWPHLLIAISLIAPTGALGTYVPTLIKGFSFGSKSESS
jgi:hypothetical protein